MKIVIYSKRNESKTNSKILNMLNENTVFFLVRHLSQDFTSFKNRTFSLRIELPYDTAILLPGIYLKNKNTNSKR